jgi:hypothetical protein
MSNDLQALMATLDAVPAPIDFFLRDDDTGWDDGRLFDLLDCTARAGVPIDLAVIPQATSAELAATLCARKAASPDLIGLHQHGFAHQNHEVQGRKCEFGDARSTQTQRADLHAGRERLRDHFGTLLDPFFTPPWNRCSAATPLLLAEMGFAALSRDRSAPPQDAIPELPVDVDWCKQQRLSSAQGERHGGGRIANELARQVAAGGPVGLMLHHAEMTSADLDLLGVLLRSTTCHPNARWRPMRELLPVSHHESD